MQNSENWKGFLFDLVNKFVVGPVSSSVFLWMQQNSRFFEPIRMEQLLFRG